MSSQSTSARVAIVTGAAGNLGRAISHRLADDGLDIALNDLPSAADALEALKKGIEAKGRRVFVFLGSVTDEAAVEKMIESTVGALGQLDVMVANAGVAKGALLLDTSVEDWNRILNVNGLGTFLCYKYAAKQMIKQGKGGRIVGASSVAGQVGVPTLGAYGSSKFAVRGLTQVAAAEWGQHGITVNAYCPGAIESDMLASLVPAEHVEAFYKDCRERAPVGYNGTPADVANLISFLVSPASHFITGQSYGTNGGRAFS